MNFSKFDISPKIPFKTLMYHSTTITIYNFVNGSSPAQNEFMKVFLFYSKDYVFEDLYTSINKVAVVKTYPSLLISWHNDGKIE